MKRIAFFIACFVLGTGMAYADSTQDHTCQGGHNCNQGGDGSNISSTDVTTRVRTGDVTNINQNTTLLTTNNTTSLGLAVGAQGGQGGASTVSINSNPSTSNSSNNTAQGGVATVGNTTTNASVSGVSGGNVGNTTATANGSGGSSNVSFSNQVAARAAAEVPPVINGSDQCRIGVAMGGSGVGFTLNLGGSTRDENCEILKLSRELRMMGLPQAALALLMQDERVKKAVDEAYLTGLDKQKGQ